MQADLPVPLGEDAVVLLLSLMLPFGFAALFFSHLLFRDYEAKHFSVQLAFSLTLMFSINMLELTVFEIVDILHPFSRWYMWRVDLYALSVMVVVILPSMFFFTLPREYGIRRRYAVALSLVGLSLYWWFFWSIGSQFPIAKQKGILALEHVIGRIGVVGVASASVLSGYGAVNTPYTYIAAFLRPITAGDIASQERRIVQTTEALLRKKKQRLMARQKLSSLRSTGSSILSSIPRPDGGAVMSPTPGRSPQGSSSARSIGAYLWDSTMQAMGLKEVDASAMLEQDAERLTFEISGLEALNKELFLELSEMREAQEKIRRSRTLWGRFLNLLGYFLSGYCVYKMFMGTINIIFDRDPRKDPVTRGFEIVLKFFSIPDAQLFVQPISFVFVVTIVSNSTRGFLKNLINMFAAWSSSVTSNSVMLVLAEVMGTYFISVVLLIRMAMPEKYRQAVTAAIGEVEFNFFHRWSDFIFVVTALFTIIVFVALRQAKNWSSPRSNYKLSADGIGKVP